MVKIIREEDKYQKSIGELIRGEAFVCKDDVDIYIKTGAGKCLAISSGIICDYFSAEMCRTVDLEVKVIKK